VTGDPREIEGLLATAPCGFVAFTDAGTVTAANATLLEMLGFASEQVIGRHVDSLLTTGGRIFYQTHLFPLLRLHGRADEIFLLLRAQDGADVATLGNAVRRERNGEWVTDCVLLPVRERRKFEEALLRAKKEAEDARAELQALNDALHQQAAELERQRAIAEDANRAKSTFLTMMSHELRTPLNAIGGYVEVLEMGIQGPVTEAQRASLAAITRSQSHLLRLINEVLNLARIESGRVDYDLEVVALRGVVDAVFPMVEPQLAARGVRCDVNVSAETAAYADRGKVQQIVLNLLSNATKFTALGGRVTVDAFADPGRADRVYLRVSDTGVGISEDRLEHIFEPFVQVDISRARRAQGTGLGLAISRDLARGMGGDLRVRSVAGVGSSFTLTLPGATRP
jgi:signal transduction histidine kinase